MDYLHYVWNTQTKDIWEVASALKENAVNVDVYLQGIKEKKRDRDTSNHHKRNIVFPAHRVMLAAASPFFKKVLSEHYAEHHDTCVNVIVPNVSQDTLRYILDFIYCGKIKVPSSARDDVIEAAKFLQIICLVNYFQPDYIVPDEKSKDKMIKQEQREENLDNAIPVEVPPKKRGRKRKVVQSQSKVDRGGLREFSNSKIKEEAVNVSALSESADGRYGRCRRRIKSRYSSDIYEVSLPEMRSPTGRGSEVLIRKEEKKQEKPKETSHSSRDENHHTYAVKLSSGNSCDNSDAFHSTDKNEDESRFEKLIEFSSSETNHALDLRATKQDQLKTELVPLPPLPSSSSSSASIVSSVVIPNLFTTDTSYLQEPNEISCASFMDSPASITTISKQNFQASSLTVANSSSSVISRIEELPVVSASPLARGALQNATLKYVSQICKPHDMSNLPDDDEEPEEEEDGLFKLQVLLKDCEDFPESVTHRVSHPLRSQTGEDEAKYEGPTDGVDISQWIAEEFQSSVMPKIHNHLSAVLAEECNGQGVTCNTSLPQKVIDHQEQQQEAKQVFNDDKEKNEAGESGDGINNEAVGQMSNTEDASENNAHEDDEEKVTHECHICGKVYPDLQSRKLHLKNFHKEAKQMCTHCGKMFRRRCDLLAHEKRHNDADLPCEICGKIFKLKKDLGAHMRIHNGGKRYSCTQCSKELTSFRNLKNHIACVHQKKRSYACHMCTKAYSKSGALQVHIRSAHTGERPFKCKICGKSFCNPCLLKMHEVSHTGEQKYSCKVCLRKFSQYSNMINHQRVHSNERPFKCVICKESYKTRESLLKHKWIHTGLKPLRCPHCCKAYRIKESFERHMLKCHDEVVHLPQIYFEMSEKMAIENVQNDIHSSSRKTVRNINDTTIGDASHIQLTDDVNNKLQNHKTLDAALPENIVPVVQFVSDISQGGTTSIELDTNDTEQLHLNSDDIQINYPILSTNPGVGDTTTLTSMADQISSETDISHPIESLLQVTIPGTNSSVIMTEDGKVNILLDC